MFNYTFTRNGIITRSWAGLAVADAELGSKTGRGDNLMRKNIRFNYFQPKLVPARQVLSEEIKGVEEELEASEFSADIWDMSALLDYIFAGRAGFDISIQVRSEIADFEPKTYSYSEYEDIYGFQLAKNRDTNIPAKRKLGEIKQEIALEDDEYIGEFNSILYDHRNSVLMIQSNPYGLTIKQIEGYFTLLRLSWIEETTGQEESNPLVVKLTTIIDPTKLDRAIGATYYRRIKIRATDQMLDALNDDTTLLSRIRQTVGRSTGINVELVLSVGRTGRTASLDEADIRMTLKKFRTIDSINRPKIDVAVKNSDEDPVEVINLIEPKMTDTIPVKIKPRQTVGHEYLFEEMKRKYMERRLYIARLLVKG